MKTKIILVIFCILVNSMLYSDQVSFSLSSEINGAEKGDIAMGDIDNDGDVDLIILGSADNGRLTEIFLNNGSGTFVSSESQGLEQLRYGEVVLADIDNDKDLDVIIQGQNSDNLGSTLTYLNDGKGKFKKNKSSKLIGLYDSVIAVGDINNDGNIDIITSGKINAVSEGLAIYLGDGKGKFNQTNQGMITAIQRGDIKLADIDNDKDLDCIVIGGGGSEGRVGKIYQNDGKGNFTEINPGDIEPVIDGTLDVGDVDGDNDPDLIICGGKSGGSRSTFLYLNDGKGKYTQDDSNSFIEVFSGDVIFGDINADNHLDLFVSGNSLKGKYIWIYINDGEGSFEGKKNRSIMPVYLSEMELADIDNNGKLDLIITGLDSSYKRRTRIYKNNTP